MQQPVVFSGFEQAQPSQPAVGQAAQQPFSATAVIGPAAFFSP